MTKGLSQDVVYWFIGASIFLTLESLFLLLRPYSLRGGKVDYPPMNFFQLYARYDKRYNAIGDGLIQLAACLNLVDVALMAAAVALDRNGRYSSAHKLAIFVSTLTSYRSALYLMTEAFEGFPYTKHLSSAEYWMAVALPVSAFILYPAKVIKDSFAHLRTPHEPLVVGAAAVPAGGRGRRE